MHVCVLVCVLSCILALLSSLMDFVRFCGTCCCRFIFAHLLLHAAQLALCRCCCSAKRLLKPYTYIVNTYTHIYVYKAHIKTYIRMGACLYVYTHRHKPESESDFVSSSKIAPGSGLLAKTKCLDKWPATSVTSMVNIAAEDIHSDLPQMPQFTYIQTYIMYVYIYSCVCACVCEYVRFACLCQLSSIFFFSFFELLPLLLQCKHNSA